MHDACRGNSLEASSQCKKATQNTTQRTLSYKLDKFQNVTKRLRPHNNPKLLINPSTLSFKQSATDISSTYAPFRPSPTPDFELLPALLPPLPDEEAEPDLLDPAGLEFLSPAD